MRKLILSRVSRDKRRTRLGRLLLLLLLMLSLTPVATQSVRPKVAYAFSLDNHIAILQQALTPYMNSIELSDVIGYYVSIGSHVIPVNGNVGNDLHQFAPQRHFDNAPNPMVICQRWSNGFNAYLNQAVADSTPSPYFWANPSTSLSQLESALNVFGEATHALADFYSHTNWVELFVKQGQSPPLAPILHSCDPNSFPVVNGEKLQSGYFNLLLYLDPLLNLTGLRFLGCPPGGPPRSYKDQGGMYCHRDLNKDELSPYLSPESLKQVPGSNTTYGGLAFQLAIAATKQLWTQEFHDRIVQTYTPQTWNVNGECIFNLLARGGNNSDCLDISGQWKGALGDPEVDIGQGLGLGGAVVVAQQGSTVAAGWVNPPTCAGGGTIPLLFSATLGKPNGSFGPISGTFYSCENAPEYADCIAHHYITSVDAETFTGIIGSNLTSPGEPGPWPLTITFTVPDPAYQHIYYDNDNQDLIGCERIINYSYTFQMSR